MEKQKSYDQKIIAITTAKTRFSTNWKKEVFTWDKLKTKLEHPVVTNETVAEYQTMSRKDKGAIKDVGGFVGGTLKGVKREKNAISSRTLITLDLDQIKGDAASLVDTYTMMAGYEAIFYSTHSHTEKAPRLRLIIPADRELTEEEYEPVARKVAENSGIPLEAFDDTTFEATRLMFWPSISKDAAYFFHHVEGSLLSVDAILSSYEDWRDVTSWPVSIRQSQLIAHARKKQEDPLKKKGLIGAFCRTYTMKAAIRSFLSDVYEPTDQEDRYTYRKGSTVKGLVIYDDVFAYSHHGTDPASRKLCNAFDLVRIHKYGALDEGVTPRTPSNRYPSYQHMLDDIKKDPDVSSALTKERITTLQSDFSYGEDDDDEWMKNIQYTAKGNIENSISNIVTIMEGDPRIKGKFRYDAFSNRAVVLSGVPWGVITEDHDFQDVDDSGLRDYLEKVYGLQSMAKVEDAKNLVFDRGKFHPVRDYIKSLPPWDGKKRIETVFHDYLGADDTLYTREVAKIHFVAAVKRVFEPGYKYDTMVILAGKQGLGKSTFIANVSKGWYSDSLYTIKGKEAAELLQGMWHIELGEMSAMKKADRDATKAFLSKQNDVFRVAYAKNTTRFPRQCVFWGTSNEYNFLRDPTGDRRSFPIDCGITAAEKDVFHDLPDEVDALWQEAYALYQQGEKTYLTGEALTLAIKVQAEHKEDTPWLGIIQDYLEADYPDNWYDLELVDRISWIKGERTGLETVYSPNLIKLDRVCALQIWCEVFDGKRQNLGALETMKINDILTSLSNWERKSCIRFNKLYGRQRGYTRLRFIP